MILLIIGVGMLNFLLPAHLNSIMFLLILKTGLARLSSPAKDFKFHYVSINSGFAFSLSLSYFPTLNSIMFLLILSRSLLLAGLENPLNSIMFLLILIAEHMLGRPLKPFKFHYVSINSLSATLFSSSVKFFKFHYVSINSIGR